MSIRRMIVCECRFIGSVASRSFAFPVIFSRKRTNATELAQLLSVQLRSELGQDLYQDVSNVVAYMDSRIGCVKLASFNRS